MPPSYWSGAFFLLNQFEDLKNCPVQRNPGPNPQPRDEQKKKIVMTKIVTNYSGTKFLLTLNEIVFHHLQQDTD